MTTLEAQTADILQTSREKSIISLYKDIQQSGLTSEGKVLATSQTEKALEIYQAADDTGAEMLVFLTGYLLQEMNLNSGDRHEISRTILRGLETYLANVGPAIKGLRMFVPSNFNESIRKQYDAQILNIFDNIFTSIDHLRQNHSFHFEELATLNDFVINASKAFRDTKGFAILQINPYYSAANLKGFQLKDTEITEFLDASIKTNAQLSEMLPTLNPKMDTRVRMAKSIGALKQLPEKDPFNILKKKVKQPDLPEGVSFENIINANVNPQDLKTSESLNEIETFGMQTLAYIAALPQGDLFTKMIVNDTFLSNQKHTLLRQNESTLVREQEKEINTLTAWQIWFISRLFQPYTAPQSDTSDLFHTTTNNVFYTFDHLNFQCLSLCIDSYILDPNSPYRNNPLIATIRKAVRENGQQIVNDLEAKWLPFLSNENLKELIANIRKVQREKRKEEPVPAIEEQIPFSPKETYFLKGAPPNYIAPSYVMNYKVNDETVDISAPHREKNDFRHEIMFAKGRVFEGMTRTALLCLVQGDELVVPEVFINLENGVDNSTKCSVRADAVVLNPRQNNKVSAIIECKFGNADTNISQTVAVHQNALQTSFPEAKYQLIHFDNRGIKGISLPADQIMDFQTTLMPQIRMYAPDITGNLELIGATMLELSSQNSSEAYEMLNAISIRCNQIIDEINNLVIKDINEPEVALKQKKMTLLSKQLSELVTDVEVGPDSINKAIQSAPVEALTPVAGHIITPDGCWRTEISIKKRSEHHKKLAAAASDEVKNRVLKLKEARGLEIKHPEIFAGLNIESKLPLILILREAFYGRSLDTSAIWKRYNTLVDLPYKNPHATILGYLDKLKNLGLITKVDKTFNLNIQNFRNTLSASGYIYEFLKTYSEVLVDNGWTLTDLLGYGDSQGVATTSEGEVTKYRLAQEARCKILYELSEAKPPVKVADFAKKLNMDEATVQSHLTNLSKAGKKSQAGNGIVTVSRGLLTDIQNPQLLEDFVITILFADAETSSTTTIQEGIQNLRSMGKDKTTISNLIRNSYDHSAYTAPGK